MRLNLAGGILAAVLIVVAMIAYGSIFTVYQTRQAIVVRLGQPVDVITQPGIASQKALLGPSGTPPGALIRPVGPIGPRPAITTDLPADA